jgi:hypothetical protein
MEQKGLRDRLGSPCVLDSEFMTLGDSLNLVSVLLRSHRNTFSEGSKMLLLVFVPRCISDCRRVFSLFAKVTQCCMGIYRI